MNDQAVFDEFLAHVTRVLEKNGFPANRVALPLERVYDAAHEKGIHFNKILERLAEQGVLHEKTSEKIIFFAAAPTEDLDAASAFGGFDPASLAGMDMAGMMAKAEEMMKAMSPEQLGQIQALYEKMSPEEKEDLARKARSMGLMP